MLHTCLYRMPRSTSAMIEHTMPHQVPSMGSKRNDTVIGAESQELRDKILKQIPSDPRKTRHLHSILNLATGERKEISLNTRTGDGMTNGAGMLSS